MEINTVIKHRADNIKHWHKSTNMAMEPMSLMIFDSKFWFCAAVIDIMMELLLQDFAQAMTAVVQLSWHVQNFVAIYCLEIGIKQSFIL